MKRIGTKPQISESPSVRDHRTRSRLIEAAGTAFSEKGYDRTTAREICDLAEANPAAVNYHFGGKEQLYVEVLREAHRRLINLGALEAAVEDMGAIEDKLESFFGSLLHSMLDPSPSSWIARLILREMTSPTKVLGEVVELQIRPTSRLFRSLIARVMDLPVDHPAVILGTLSTVGQFMFIFQNRSVIRLVLPELDLGPEGIDTMARHIWLFTAAGLRAAAQEAKKGMGA